MEFRNVRAQFMEILGNACACGEKREQVLELSKKSSNDPRKINHILREKGVEETFNVLKEDFLILCLNCKRLRDLNDKELQNKKARNLKVSRIKYYDKKRGKKRTPFIEIPMDVIEKIYPEETLQFEYNDVPESIQKMLNSGNVTQIAMARRLLEIRPKPKA